MATTKASLAWSVPVAVDTLAAHLDAYARLHHPHKGELRTLRLCHRYGQGASATITRLPVELLAHIEDYLTNDVRGEILADKYAQDFLCWQGRCKRCGG